MILSQDDNKSLYLVSLLILLTRIPFLFSGFGSEEDAWGLILVATKIAQSGIYEVSRMPGHPVQELLLAQIYQLPSWLLNLLTSIVSTLGVLFFMRTLRMLHIRNVIPSGIALAFVPVFYINSTTIMDYTWTLSLVLIAFHEIVRGKYLTASIVLGIACGFRITAGGMVLPFAWYIYSNTKSIRPVLMHGIITTLVALVCFIPPFRVYGTSFFTYYEYFPYPPLLKNIYKGTIGAWGPLGFLAIVMAIVAGVFNFTKLKISERAIHLPLLFMCGIVMVIYTYSFLKIPQKSAFVLPMVPFIILFISIFLSKKMMNALALSMIISSFFVGINLDDPLRGSESSALSVQATIGNTPVSIDLLNGMVPADGSKKKQKINYATGVVHKLSTATQKTLIIAGWWQNELNYFSMKNKNPQVTYVYYSDEKELSEFKKGGYEIYFLPEQDYYNDLRFKGNFTHTFSQPFLFE